MSARKTRKYVYIDTNAKLKGLLGYLKDLNRIALDIEADSYHHYYEKVCLVQLTAHGKNYIIDPLSQTNIPEFLKAISRKELIFHDAGYDLRMLRSSFDFKLRGGIFDTMIAAQ